MTPTIAPMAASASITPPEQPPITLLVNCRSNLDRAAQARRYEVKGGTDGLCAQGAVDAGTAAGVGWRTGLDGDQGQVGHRGRQVQLEFRLGAPEVAGLADSQLDQPRQPVLHHHPALPVLAKGLTLLQGPGLLQ